MLRLAVRVSRAQAELALAELIELMPDGVEEVDIDADTVEYAVYGSVGELPELPALRAAVGGALVDIITTEVAGDWAERWREFHKPLVLGTRLSVRPPWEPAQHTQLDLIIDPGRAFGTGAHATTRLCLEMLLELPTPSAAIRQLAAASPDTPFAIDLGCGSGVLAIAADRLGWGPVLALDYDPLCIDATLENAAVNGVTLLGVRGFDLRSEPVPYAPLVLANLLAPLLLLWAEALKQPDAEGPGAVIASGLLVTEADAVAAGFTGCGYAEVKRMEQGEWAALLLSREPR